MKWNIFKKHREKKQQKEVLRHLSELGANFRTYDRLAECGLLEWDVKGHRLLIDATLAALFIHRAESWVNFIGNCYIWNYYNQCQESWDTYMTMRELAAVRKESERRAAAGERAMTDAEARRLREAIRMRIGQEEHTGPKVEPFEFFIVGVETKDESKPEGVLIAVGRYDPDTEDMTLAPWDEVATQLERTKR